MDEASVLALLAVTLQAGPRCYDEGESMVAATSTLVWARTSGLAEVYRKEREWKEQRENEAVLREELAPMDLPANGGAHPDGPVCGACGGKGGLTPSFAPNHFIVCPSCDGKGWRPPTYEEAHITSPSGMPRTSTKE